MGEITSIPMQADCLSQNIFFMILFFYFSKLRNTFIRTAIIYYKASQEKR